MTIRTKVAIGVLLILVVTLGGAAITALTERRQRVALDEVAVAAETVSGHAMTLIRTAKDVAFDVIQVQQFLSDVSATRARDGLGDGFSDATRFAEKFEADVAAATVEANALHRGDIVAILADSKAAFAGYYEFGQRMARAYVEAGPEGGNPLMPQFDKTSEYMQAKVERILTQVETTVGETTSHLRQSIAEIQDGGERLARLTVLLAVVGVGAAAGIGVLLFLAVVRPLGAMTDTMRELAQGNLKVKVPAGGRRDEMGAMAAAVEVFRDQMVRAERLTAEQAVERERTDTEKREALATMAGTINLKPARRWNKSISGRRR